MVFQTVIGGYRSLELVSWANGTPSQLAAMLDAHYAGRINLANYWSVGDTRTVAIDAIAASSASSAMAAQTAQLVLMNVGGKTLVNAEHGVTTCAFIVGFKNCLTGNVVYTTATSGNSARYSASTARQFLSNQLFLALPSDMQSIFKTFVNKATEYTSYSTSSLVETEDLLALPAAVEVTGATPMGALSGEGSIFTYYNTAANRIKTRSGAASPYWTRTSRSQSTVNRVDTNGANSESSVSSGAALGISPFGVI